LKRSGNLGRLWTAAFPLSFIFLLFFSRPLVAEELLTLSDVLKIALSENPLIVAWDAKVKMGEGELISARAYPNPEIGGDLGRITRFDPGKNQGSFELSQMVEVPAKRKYRRQAAEMDLKALSYETEGLKLDLIFEVKSAFYRILLTQKNLEAARNNEKSAQMLLSTAKIRVRLGEAAKSEAIKAQVELARASNEVQKALTNVSLAKTSLNTWMGRPGTRSLDVVGELESIPQEFTLEALLQKAMERHPYIQQQNYLVAKFSHLFDLAKASRYPDPTIIGFYEREPDKEVVGLGFSIPVPLWYREKGAIASAAGEKARAEAELIHLRNEINRTVTEAFQGQLIAKDLVQVFEKQLLKKAEESRRIAEISYREGASGILDLIEAQRTFRQTLLEYEQALYELRLAEAALERATGGGT
jgi:outer membrane protein, heavy metal efflux system